MGVENMTPPRTTKKQHAGAVFLNVVRPLGLDLEIRKSLLDHNFGSTLVVEPRTTEVYEREEFFVRPLGLEPRTTEV